MPLPAAARPTANGILRSKALRATPSPGCACYVRTSPTRYQQLPSAPPSTTVGNFARSLWLPLHPLRDPPRYARRRTHRSTQLAKPPPQPPTPSLARSLKFGLRCWPYRALGGVGTKGVQIRIGGSATADHVEVIEGSRRCAPLAEPEAGRLQLGHSTEDVHEPVLAKIWRTGRLLTLVVFAEHPVVAQQAERLSGQCPVHGLDPHDLRRISRQIAVPGVAERDHADKVRIDEDLVADLERVQETRGARKHRIWHPDALGRRLAAVSA